MTTVSVSKFPRTPTPTRKAPQLDHALIQLRNTGLRIAWIMTFSFDILIFLLTIARTYRFVKAQAALQLHSGLAALVMRDGTSFSRNPLVF